MRMKAAPLLWPVLSAKSGPRRKGGRVKSCQNSPANGCDVCIWYRSGDGAQGAAVKPDTSQAGRAGGVP
ncbi:hypothetical protein QQF64_002681 [Cirrhinus molitorella]|uniref:Prolactin receptor n=1 Tax=Cirrhinus molitorella TaxID=172907 RepID=A0ABR3MQV3_9TELE